MPKRVEKVGILKIVDGDTVNVSRRAGLMGSKSVTERIRLYGIDAPESDQEGGDASTKYLKKLVGGNKSIWLERKETDRYGRTVGLIYKDKGNPKNSYNYQMVLGGHAHVYLVKPEDRERYRAAEREAKSKNRGMWKKRKKMVMPTEHRAKGRRAQKLGNRIRWAILALAVGGIGYMVIRNMEGIREFARQFGG